MQEERTKMRQDLISLTKSRIEYLLEQKFVIQASHVSVQLLVCLQQTGSAHQEEQELAQDLVDKNGHQLDKKTLSLYAFSLRS